VHLDDLLGGGKTQARAAANGHFALSVSDTGPGIPLQERDRIFGKFHHIDNTITKAKGQPP
jgi:signal transduction histidine kinase